MTKFTPKELNCLLYFLEDYASILGRRGLNDLPGELESLFNLDEGAEIARKCNIMNNNGRFVDGEGSSWPVPDFCLLSYIASKLNGEYQEYFGEE